MAGFTIDWFLLSSFRRRPESRRFGKPLDSAIHRNHEKNISDGFLNHALQSLRVAAVAFFLNGAVLSIAAAQPVTPFFSSNQSPVIQLHNLPAIDSASILQEHRARYRLVNGLASNYTVENKPNEKLLFDGETNRTTFVYSRGVGKGWEWGVQIPFVNHSGGSLDSFIEDWHSTFGLPQGGRNTAPRNQFKYFYQRNGVSQLSLTKATSGIGDVRLTAGRQWPNAGKGIRLAIRSSLSLPTGDSDQLRGSGTAEAALWVSADRNASWFNYPGGAFGGGGLLLMGKGDVLADQQRHVAAFASLGAGVRVLPWMTLKLQADVNSSFYDASSLSQINATAVQLLMGGDLRINKHVQVDVMVGEDITVHASPDVVFHLDLVVE